MSIKIVVFYDGDCMKNTLRIAFYGKGGIGKSTIAANVASVLSHSGKKTLLIGCDPKGDSTRLLVPYYVEPLLEKLSNSSKELSEKDILTFSDNNLYCIEVGGPPPGVGCAGRGLSTAIDYLENEGILDKNWDVIIFDVLGDVVCGGFSVPIIKEYVDYVYIVTSDEYMSVFAMNNLIASLCDFKEYSDFSFGGIIYNERYKRNVEHSKLLGEYLEGVNLSVLYSIPYSESIKEGDYLGKTIDQMVEKDNPFGALAHILLTNKGVPLSGFLTRKEMYDLNK